MEQMLVSFGNYLFKRYGVQVYSTDGKNIPIYDREVCDADLANWKHENPQIKNTELPSRFVHGDRVKVFLMPEGVHDFPGFTAYVTGVHFYLGKVKYDLEMRFAGDFATRIYNIDSVLVLEDESWDYSQRKAQSYTLEPSYDSSVQRSS